MKEKKPTIEDLEKILDGAEPTIEILPDGSIRAVECKECDTLKTTNESLMGTVAMLRKALEDATVKGCRCPGPGRESWDGVACHQWHKALTATEATVKEWMAKRDEEKDKRISELENWNRNGMKEFQEAQATLAEKEKWEVLNKRVVVKLERDLEESQKWLKDREATLAEKEKGDDYLLRRVNNSELELKKQVSAWFDMKDRAEKAEEALAKRDKEVIMLRGFTLHDTTCKHLLSVNYACDCGLTKALSYTANLGARYKAELLRAEAKGEVRAFSEALMLQADYGGEHLRHHLEQRKTTALTKEADSLEEGIGEG